ncbi:MAG: orotate phosphoribosyltransferase, partial [Nanoarchaeota archaeon]
MNDYSRLIAEKALDIKAVKLSPEKPFEWASGYSMPIYNDNRMFLFFPEYRKLIVNGLKDIIESQNLEYDVIAGTSTAGIAPGALLAEKLESPFIYVR